LRILAIAALAGLCLQAHDARAAVFPCSEAGVLAAIAAGGGPHTFSCGGPTTVVTSAELVISQSVELDGGGLLTLSGGGSHRVLVLLAQSSSYSATLRNLRITDGHAEVGGCILSFADLLLDHVEVTGCEAQIGAGGIYADAPLQVLDSLVADNTTAEGPGGGIAAQGLDVVRSSVRNNRALSGGGIFARHFTSISDSTISGNVGGGLLFSSLGYSVSVARSTIAHNEPSAAGNGSGVVASGAIVEVEDSTLAANRPRAIEVYTQVFPPIEVGSLGLRNTIISGSCIGKSDIESGGGNFERPGHTCIDTDADDQADVGAAALDLGKLGNHGGPTHTIPLHPLSVAIDAAPGCLSATDQRGVARPQGGACDAGAFEFDGAEPVPALPWLGVAALFAALCLAGLWSLRGRRPA
jgi:hypothetical protein